MATESRLLSGITAALGRSKDPAGLGAFRALFGLVLLASVIRFAAKGWIAELYLDPPFHFSYEGFEWVRVLSPSGMYLLFAVMATSAAAIMLGFFTRPFALLFCLAFTYVELIDKATYLNHYYFVSLMSLLLAFVPSDAWASVLPRKLATPRAVPAFSYALLRFQTAVVYVFAGLAKLDADWLFRAEPLKTWLYAYTDTPVVGALLVRPEVPFVMSWCGAAFDISIVPLLLWRKSRAYAFLAAIAFHGIVGLLFPIGMFPWIMLVSATTFFHPSWPRRLLRIKPAPLTASVAPALPVSGTRALPTAVLVATALYAALQIAVPLRFLIYPGSVNWTEQGFRFAWRVMLIEKTGQVEYQVVTRAPDGNFLVNPRAELTAFQYRMLSTQPDMIHDYALALADRFHRRGHAEVHVFARAFASLNGRPSEQLIDPSVDLAHEPRSLAPKRWIFREPTTETLRVLGKSALQEQSVSTTR